MRRLMAGVYIRARIPPTKRRASPRLLWPPPRFASPELRFTTQRVALLRLTYRRLVCTALRVNCSPERRPASPHIASLTSPDRRLASPCLRHVAGTQSGPTTWRPTHAAQSEEAWSNEPGTGPHPAWIA